MTRAHTYTVEIEFGGDEPTALIEVTLAYTFHSGCAAWGGSRFEPPINPPEGPLIEDLTVTHIDGKPRPWAWLGQTDAELEDIILNRIGDSLDDALIDNATGDA